MDLADSQNFVSRNGLGRFPEFRDQGVAPLPFVTARFFSRTYTFWLANNRALVASVMGAPEKTPRTQEGYARVSCELGAPKARPVAEAAQLVEQSVRSRI
jgi:hypothetical protein